MSALTARAGISDRAALRYQIMGKGNRSREQRRQEVSAFSLTPAQRKAMNQEINAQIAEKEKQYYLDMDAAVLYSLHQTFGFGKKRLRMFFDAFAIQHEELRQRYQLDDDTNTWLCRRLLKEEVGVDVEAWEKEFDTKNEQ